MHTQVWEPLDPKTALADSLLLTRGGEFTGLLVERQTEITATAY